MVRERFLLERTSLGQKRAALRRRVWRLREQGSQEQLRCLAQLAMRSVCV